MNRFQVIMGSNDADEVFFVVWDETYNTPVKDGHGEPHSFRREDHAEYFAQAMCLGYERQEAEEND